MLLPGKHLPAFVRAAEMHKTRLVAAVGETSNRLGDIRTRARSFALESSSSVASSVSPRSKNDGVSVSLNYRSSLFGSGNRACPPVVPGP